MGGGRARRLCPGLVAVVPRFQAYVEASRAVFEVFRDTSPVVEGLGLEEAFLDVRGLERISGSPEEIAVKLRTQVREHVGLPLSVGIANTKVLAKIASRSAKPDGLFVVPAGGELAFLHPLPVERVWGIGDATAEKLHQVGLTTVGELAALPRAELMSLLGKATGRHVHAIAHNRDPRRVRAGKGRRSLGSQRALGRAARSPEELDAVVIALSDRVARRMRAAGFAGRTVVLRLRFRRLRARVALAHSRPAHRGDRDDPRRGAGAAGRCDAGDRAPGITLLGLTHPQPRGRRRAARISARRRGERRARRGRRRCAATGSGPAP